MVHVAEPRWRLSGGYSRVRIKLQQSRLSVKIQLLAMFAADFTGPHNDQFRFEGSEGSGTARQRGTAGGALERATPLRSLNVTLGLMAANTGNKTKKIF